MVKIKFNNISIKKVIKSKKVSLKVNGKTNSKCVVTFNVKLTKKGSFKYTVKFVGDSTYKAVSKTNKIIVK